MGKLIPPPKVYCTVDDDNYVASSCEPTEQGECSAVVTDTLDQLKPGGLW